MSHVCLYAHFSRLGFGVLGPIYQMPGCQAHHSGPGLYFGTPGARGLK